MVLTINLPDHIARALADNRDRELPRRVLEAIAIDGYRDQRLTQKQVGELLDISRIQTEDFLAARLDLYDYDPSELNREAELLEEFSQRSKL
jgi:hypothetical protein